MVSDGLACFAGVTIPQCLHMPIVVGRAQPKELPEFHWVDTVLGNLRRTVAGAHHGLKFGKYADAYLAGFAYRFSRRFDLRALVAWLIVDVARAKPKSLRVVRQVEEHCLSGPIMQAADTPLQVNLRHTLRVCICVNSGVIELCLAPQFCELPSGN